MVQIHLLNKLYELIVPESYCDWLELACSLLASVLTVILPVAAVCQLALEYSLHHHLFHKDAPIHFAAPLSGVTVSWPTIAPWQKAVLYVDDSNIFSHNITANYNVLQTKFSKHWPGLASRSFQSLWIGLLTNKLQRAPAKTQCCPRRWTCLNYCHNTWHHWTIRCIGQLNMCKSRFYCLPHKCFATENKKIVIPITSLRCKILS